MAHRYRLTLRPLDFTTVPKGYDLDSMHRCEPQHHKRFDFGSVAYPEPLSLEQVRDFDLLYLGEDVYDDGKVVAVQFPDHRGAFQVMSLRDVDEDDVDPESQKGFSLIVLSKGKVVQSHYGSLEYTKRQQQYAHQWPENTLSFIRDDASLAPIAETRWARQ